MTNVFACVRMRVEVHRSARVVFYVHVLASYFRAPLFFVSFLRLPPKKNFGILCFRASFAVSCAQKKVERTEHSLVFFRSCAFTATSFALPGCIRAISSSSHTRAVPSQRAQVGQGQGVGKGVTWQPLMRAWFSV